MTDPFDELLEACNKIPTAAEAMRIAILRGETPSAEEVARALEPELDGQEDDFRALVSVPVPVLRYFIGLTTRTIQRKRGQAPDSWVQTRNNLALIAYHRYMRMIETGEFRAIRDELAVDLAEGVTTPQMSEKTAREQRELGESLLAIFNAATDSGASLAGASELAKGLASIHWCVGGATIAKKVQAPKSRQRQPHPYGMKRVRKP